MINRAVITPLTGMGTSREHPARVVGSLGRDKLDLSVHWVSRGHQRWRTVCILTNTFLIKKTFI